MIAVQKSLEELLADDGSHLDVDDFYTDLIPYENYNDYVLQLRTDIGKWRDKGNCSGPLIDMFPAEKKRQQIMAEQVCSTCPALTQCLYVALVGQEYYGVWGGTTESERIEIIDKIIDVVGDYKREWDTDCEEVIRDTTTELVKAIKAQASNKESTQDRSETQDSQRIENVTVSSSYL